ncbi:hypothetical protein AHAS_Ahas05G0058400 [Arachis hypogaea]
MLERQDHLEKQMQVLSQHHVDGMRAFKEFTTLYDARHLNQCDYDMNDQFKLNYILEYMPDLNSVIKRYDEIFERLSKLEKGRALRYEETVEKKMKKARFWKKQQKGKQKEKGSASGKQEGDQEGVKKNKGKHAKE